MLDTQIKESIPLQLDGVVREVQQMWGVGARRPTAQFSPMNDSEYGDRTTVNKRRGSETLTSNSESSQTSSYLIKQLNNEKPKYLEVPLPLVVANVAPTSSGPRHSVSGHAFPIITAN